LPGSGGQHRPFWGNIRRYFPKKGLTEIVENFVDNLGIIVDKSLSMWITLGAKSMQVDSIKKLSTKTQSYPQKKPSYPQFFHTFCGHFNYSPAVYYPSKKQGLSHKRAYCEKQSYPQNGWRTTSIFLDRNIDLKDV
jgi:hypothetical protein